MKKNFLMCVVLFCLVLCACPVPEPPDPISIKGRITLENTLVTAMYQAASVDIWDKNGNTIQRVIPTPLPTPIPSNMPQWAWEATFITSAEITPVTIFVELDLNGDKFYSEGTEAMAIDGSVHDLYVRNNIDTNNRIFTKEDLLKIGRDPAFPLDGKYILMNDINLGGITWNPIGTGASAFSGVFSGGSHTISGLKLSAGTKQHIGLFGYIRGTGSSHASVRNLKISLEPSSVNLPTSSYIHDVGVVCGYAENAVFQNIIVEGGDLTITKTGVSGVRAGGIVGELVSSVTTVGGTKILTCGSLIPITIDADVNFPVAAGGIAGYVSYKGDPTKITIEKSYSAATITSHNAQGEAYAGGIIGYSFLDYSGPPLQQGDATINECYSSGNISCSGTTPVAGGIIGQFYTPSSEQSNMLTKSISLNDVITITALAGSGSVGKITGTDTLHSNSASNYYLMENIIVPTGTITTVITAFESLVYRISATEAWFAAAPIDWDFNSIWKWDTYNNRPIFKWQ